MAGVSHPFPARYAGHCDHCDRRFEAGATVAFHPDYTRPVHVACARGDTAPAADPTALRQGESVCPDCHLVHPGEC